MNVEQFQTKYDLKRPKKDSCGELIFCGTPRPSQRALFKRPEDYHHVYEVDGVWFVYLNCDTTSKWRNAVAKLTAAGGRIFQDCHCDGIIAFDPEDVALTLLVFKLTRIRVKRKMTPEQREQLKKRLRQTEMPKIELTKEYQRGDRA